MLNFLYTVLVKMADSFMKTSMKQQTENLAQYLYDPERVMILLKNN